MTTIETEWYDCDTLPLRDGAYKVRTLSRGDPDEYVIIEIFLDGAWWHPGECGPCGLSPEQSWRGLVTEQPLSTRAELALVVIDNMLASDSWAG